MADFTYTRAARRLLQLAEQEARGLGHQFIGSEHLLLAMLQLKDSVAGTVLAANEVEWAEVRAQMDQFLSRGGSVPVMDGGSWTPKAERILRMSRLEVQLLQTEEIGTEHILLAMIKESENVAMRLLRSLHKNLQKIFLDVLEALGIKPEEYRQRLEAAGFRPNREEDRQDSILDSHSRDLTAMAEGGRLDPVIGRERELTRMIEILSRRTKNNPCLTGDPGVGKTALVEGLALHIAAGQVPDLLKNKRIMSLDLSSLIAGTKYRGEFEERMKQLLEELRRRRDIILFVDELHTVIGAGGSEGSLDASNILKPALSRGEVQMIGATTRDEFRKYIEKDGALARRFQPIDVQEPDTTAALEILEGIKGQFETFHQVQFTKEALEAAVNLSKRYISDRFLPDKAIDVMDEAAAKVHLRQPIDDAGIRAVQEARVNLQIAERAMELALGKRHAETIVAAREQLHQAKQQLEAVVAGQRRNKRSKQKVTEKDVAAVVSLWTGVPLSKLTQKETGKLAKLEQILHKRVIGQDEAVKAVAKAVKRGRVGLKDPNRPVGSFLFLGPTGVGKTELSKALAEAVFGTEEAMIRVDMSEYMEKHSVSKLIGSPPGYVGYDEGGQLAEKVRRHPYSVILFDEIEKAHPDIFNILLQVLDDGVMTDAQGRKIDFKNTILIMTSNVGARNIIDPKKLGFLQTTSADEEHAKMRGGVMEELKQLFRPEFLNRIDETIVFRALQKEDMLQIAEIMLTSVEKRAVQLSLNLKIQKDAKEFLVEKGTDRKYGARPIRRAIQTYLEDALSAAYLEGRIKAGQTVQVTAGKEELVLTAVKKPVSQNKKRGS